MQVLVVRGEGAGMVVLRRLSDALAAGDRVLAVIRGSAVNQDGRSDGLAAPSPAAQRALLLQALDRAGLEGSNEDKGHEAVTAAVATWST